MDSFFENLFLMFVHVRFVSYCVETNFVDLKEFFVLVTCVQNNKEMDCS